MSRQVALFGAILGLWWLFASDRKRGLNVSWATWVPLLWLVIVGSKAPSSWFGADPDSAEGSPLDRFIFFGLLLIGLRILKKRNVRWAEVYAENKWVLIFFAYLGISILWSDHAFSSLKLWVKNVGNIVMILIMLSEPNPEQAVKAVLVRSCYILAGASFLLVKYFPEMGRVYDTWSFRPKFVGVSTSKNELGATLFVCGVGLLWSMVQAKKKTFAEKRSLFPHLVILVMTGWLLFRSHSATSIACLVIGGGLLVAIQREPVRRLIGQLGLSAFIYIPLFIVTAHQVFSLGEVLVWTLGRDLTFTGRTSIWEWCVKADINPLIGTGYCDFWRGPRARIISQGIGFYYVLKEAHNGYLETYLNSGLIGLILLLTAIGTGTRRILDRLRVPSSLEQMRFTLLILGLLYNLSESAFDGLNIVWFSFLLAILRCPGERDPAFIEQSVPAEAEDLPGAAPSPA